MMMKIHLVWKDIKVIKELMLPLFFYGRVADGGPSQSRARARSGQVL